MSTPKKSYIKLLREVRSVEEEQKNVPDDKALWARALAKAKSKFDVWPSAYGSAWASKWYKEQGGTWSVAKKE